MKQRIVLIIKIVTVCLCFLFVWFVAAASLNAYNTNSRRTRLLEVPSPDGAYSMIITRLGENMGYGEFEELSLEDGSGKRIAVFEVYNSCSSFSSNQYTFTWDSESVSITIVDENADISYNYDDLSKIDLRLSYYQEILLIIVFVLLVVFFATCVILIFCFKYWRQCLAVIICNGLLFLLCAVGFEDNRHEICSDSFDSGKYRVITCVENSDYCLFKNQLNNLSVRYTLYDNDSDVVLINNTIGIYMQGEEDRIETVPSFDNGAIHILVSGGDGFEIEITSSIQSIQRIQS